MNIIENINERLTFDEDEICPGGEKDMEEIIRISPVPLPKDYLDFLQQISGENSYGPEFEVDDGEASIWIWSANMALSKRQEFNEPFNQDFLQNVWLFGDDLGDFVYFFGTGKDGFGLYRISAGQLSIQHAEKISNTLTEFLVDGMGIDLATTL